MNKTYINIIVLIFLSGSIYSQKISDLMSVNNEELVHNKSTTAIAGYDGSPFLDKEFIEGSVITSEGKLYEAVPLRYNVYNDIFEFDNDGTPYNLDPVKFGSKISIKEQVFIYKPYFHYNNSQTGYIELLVKGNYSVYKRYKVRYDRPKPAGAYSDTKPGTFVKLNNEYFLQDGEDGQIRFITKDSQFIELCGDNGDVVKTYMKENKLKTKKEKHLIEIINFLNTL